MSNQPGCFGSPTCCNDKLDICKQCPYLASCQDASKDRAERLRAKFGMDRFKTTPVFKDGVRTNKTTKPENFAPQYVRMAMNDRLTYGKVDTNRLARKYVSKLGYEFVAAKQFAQTVCDKLNIERV